jgi:hypothetical protein
VIPDKTPEEASGGSVFLTIFIIVLVLAIIGVLIKLYGKQLYARI